MSYCDYLLETYGRKGTWFKGVENDITHSLDNGLDKTLANILKRTEKSVIDSTLNRKLTLHESLRNKMIAEYNRPLTMAGRLLAEHFVDEDVPVPNLAQGQAIKKRSNTAHNQEVNSVLSGMKKSVAKPNPPIVPQQPSDTGLSQSAPKPRIKRASAPAPVNTPTQQPAPSVSNNAQNQTASQPQQQGRDYDAEYAARMNKIQGGGRSDTGFGAYMKRKAASAAQNSAKAIGNAANKAGKAFMGANAKVDQWSRGVEKDMGNKMSTAYDKWQSNRSDVKDAKNAYKETQRQKKLDLVRDYGTSSAKGLGKQMFKQDQRMAKANDIAQHGTGIGGFMRKNFGQAGADSRHQNKMAKLMRKTELNTAKNMQFATKHGNFKKSFGQNNQASPMLRDFQRWQSMYSR